MATDNVSPPGSSGRVSPATRPPRRQLEDEPRRQDKNYRRYASGIERALVSFDTARLEWPDYISFLGRLLKAIQAHTGNIDNIPHKFAVANKLAQCLKPSLPSGVHQKAIEVYGYIFSQIGSDTLAADLAVYLPGLSQVLSFASLSLRPVFLSLVETHIASLDVNAIRPALKAVILCLLPGLEEESSEDFVRTLQIVDKLKDSVSRQYVNKPGSPLQSVGEEYFWQCFFLASISNPSRRPGALSYLSRRLPMFSPNPQSNGTKKEVSSSRLSLAAESCVSPEPGLLIRCLTTGLEDEQILIQRGFLDLLLSNLPTNSPLLHERVEHEDLELLMGAATSVVARRDMSLNRRLWNWFLGPDAADELEEDTTISSPVTPKSASAQKSFTSAYFEKFGAKALMNSLLTMLSHPSTEPVERARPFRVCLSLMDRREIGGSVVSHIFLPAIRNILAYQEVSSAEHFQEVLKSANSFFDGVESAVIWNKITQSCAKSLVREKTSLERRESHLNLVDFIIENFNVRDEEMLTIYIPLTVLHILATIDLRESELNHSADGLPLEVTNVSLQIAEKLINLMPERTGLNTSVSNDRSEKDEDPQKATILEEIQKFYSRSSGEMSTSSPPYSSKRVGELLQIHSSSLFVRSVSSQELPQSTSLRARIFSSIVSKFPGFISINLERTISIFTKSMLMASNRIAQGLPPPFITLSAISQVIVDLISIHPGSNTWSADEFLNLVSLLVQYIWVYLSPSCPRHHIEAVRCMWQLEELVSNERLVEATVAKYLQSSHNRTAVGQIDQIRRFTVLWTHTMSHGTPARQHNTLRASLVSGGQQTQDQDSQDHLSRLHRPLFLVLDTLNEDSLESSNLVRGWLESLSNIRRIFDVILARIALYEPSLSSENGDGKVFAEHRNKSSERLYFLRHLSNLLRISSERMWKKLSEPMESESNQANIDSKKHTMLTGIAEMLLQIARTQPESSASSQFEDFTAVRRLSLSILQTILQSPDAASLQNLKLDEALIELLRYVIQKGLEDSSTQVVLLEALLAALKLRSPRIPSTPNTPLHKRTTSTDAIRSVSKLPLHGEANDASSSQEHLAKPSLPPELVKCLQDGISSALSTNVLDRWINFLIQILPLFSGSLIQNLIPLVESFCRRITNIFQDLTAAFTTDTQSQNISPEPALITLLNGLETTLATGHDQMSAEEPKRNVPKTPEQTPGFFGNVVSGVFTSEAQRNRHLAANTRLTVILCFQDAIRVCLPIWSWAGYSSDTAQQDPTCLASFGFISQRLRNKTRRILDRMFAAETLECVEALILAWANQGHSTEKRRTPPTISLLHVLDSSSPKHTIPALFNAIYSRTSPGSIEQSRVSSMTCDINDVELAQYLISYTQSLDDDAMDEIWADCMTFLRDVLTNPLPHHHILPSLLSFLTLLAEKFDNTNFGEQRKTRRELGDLFLRLLTATFTTRSSNSLLEPASPPPSSEKHADGDGSKSRAMRRKARYVDFIETLASIVPRMQTVLSENDRYMSAVSSISTNVISPLVHSKTFPESLRIEYFTLWHNITKFSSASKLWKKDVLESFMHPKLFATNVILAEEGWTPIFRQLSLNDKDRITDLCARTTAPTTAGIMFGVGASAARLDADKKTQLNLRRIAFLVLVADQDFLVPSLPAVEEKIAELLNATTASSPSSSTRAEVFMLFRAIILKTSYIHLASLWPVLTSELQKSVASALPGNPEFETYNTASLLQACKLLDLLITLNPDDFQLQEWLFITDTIEAAFRPGGWEPVALVDDIAEELEANNAVAESVTPVHTTRDRAMTLPETGTSASLSPRKQSERPIDILSPSTPRRSNSNPNDALSSNPQARSSSQQTVNKFRTPLLDLPAAREGEESFIEMTKEDFVKRVLRPFFSQLSIHAYESTYEMKKADWDGCWKGLVADLFDEGTIVG